MQKIQKTQNYRKPLAVITSLYFLFGFITCMNDVLVPHLKGIFTLNYTQAILTQFAFFSSYFLISIPASKFCERFGYPNGMSTGLLITAFGALGFLGSANLASYPLFLVSLFVLAGGITLIQVAVNPYITLLGPPERASSRMSLSGAFNSLGTMIAPLIGSFFILAHASVDSVKMPYALIAAALLTLAVLVRLAKLPRISTPEKEVSPVTWQELLANRRFMMGTWAIFAYVGAEVAIGSFLTNWLSDPNVGGLPLAMAGRYVAFYWGGAMIGRFIGAPLLSRFEPLFVMKAFVGGAVGFTLLSIAAFGANPQVAMGAILSVGLFNSILWPIIFSESIVELKRGTEKASGILCTAIVGGAVIPLVQGLIADSTTLRWSFLVPVACYGYLYFFAAEFHANRKQALSRESAPSTALSTS